MTVRKKPALLIFDLDDTLVHSKIDFVKLGNWIREQMIRRQIIDSNHEGLYSMSVSQMLYLAKECDLKKGTRHAQELWQKVEEAEMEGALRATVEKDVHKILEALKKKDYFLSIFTNNSSLVAKTVLERFNLIDFIDETVTRDDIKLLKPDPEGLLLLKEKFENQVHKMFFIGDSWIDGVAANRAQMPFIGFNCQEPREVKMLYNVTGLVELADYLEQIFLLGREENAI